MNTLVKILILTSAWLTLHACADASFSRSGKKTGTSDTPPPPSTPTQPGTPPTIPGSGSTPGGGPNTDLDLEWGSSVTAWHIGDNKKADTSCKLRVFTNLIDSQQSANFYFTVHQDNTSLVIEPMHCGSEGPAEGYNGKIELLDAVANSVINNLQVALNSSQNFFFMSTQYLVNPFNQPTPVVLNAGRYKIRMSTSQRSDGDWDDIVVRARIKNPSATVTIDKQVKQQ